ncbi:hypothetical protein [Enterobacter cancerogenus]|uniref:hypothetical protein n=1 Tax=Enterobacter cancerogenus TaxID=69218 RepID=UPI0007342805|nr:hypothetical protein [Enterobacter cancerogenus]KTQ46866.1 hypothetical protein NS104_14355 [Enterobacter cancerogenus]KTQ51167.1 hypothetical protein NS111_14960 [Enterobacter cancerogenus]KTQ73834.1 hypothetical protein NS188_09985 [Enterobacter cancerogenus]KTQ77248.1 hypothetical protein NS31R_20590 [Enterobacter cancerogenus]
MHNVVAEFRSLSEREEHHIGEKKLASLLTDYERTESKVSAVRKLLKQMETYGLKPAPDRRPAFETMLRALDQCASLVYVQCLLLTVQYHGGPSSEEISDLILADTYGLITRWDNGESWETLSSEMLQKLHEAWTSVTYSQQTFRETGSQIGKLFKVKK